MLEIEKLPERLRKMQSSLAKFRSQNEVFFQERKEGVATAPSNIALLKYWGKDSTNLQMPLGPSISMTLGSFRTETHVRVAKISNDISQPNSNEDFDTFSLKGLHDRIPAKMALFLKMMKWGWAEDICLEIQTTNGFPSACGIASSASGYAALVGACADLFQLKKILSPEDFTYWLWEWSRLGSGSAARSSLPGDPIWVRWAPSAEGTERSTEVRELQGQSLGHCVVILSEEKKKISSSDGHKSASTSLFHPIRMGYLPNADSSFQDALQTNNWDMLKQLAEHDALLMHAVMSTGEPPAIYLNKTTSLFIQDFVLWRSQNDVKAFWTLDAGPNPHLLFPHNQRHKIESFLKRREWSHLKTLWNENHTGLRIGRGEGSSLLK